MGDFLGGLFGDGGGNEDAEIKRLELIQERLAEQRKERKAEEKKRREEQERQQEAERTQQEQQRILGEIQALAADISPSPTSDIPQTPTSQEILQQLSGIQPEKISLVGRIGGTLGDALKTFAAVRGGQAPPSGSTLDSLRRRRQQEAQTKRQDLLLRAGSAERGEARQAGITERVEREQRGIEREDTLITEQRGREDAKEAERIARGESVELQSILAGLRFAGLDSSNYDLTTVQGKARAQGDVMRFELQQRQDAEALKRKPPDKRRTNESVDIFRDEIDKLEASIQDPKFFEGLDPASLRRLFYSRVRRRLADDPDAASTIISQFEEAVGPTIDAEIDRRKPKADAGGGLLGTVRDFMSAGGGRQSLVAGKVGPLSRQNPRTAALLPQQPGGGQDLEKIIRLIQAQR